jgi:hypothetical protein
MWSLNGYLFHHRKTVLGLVWFILLFIGVYMISLKPLMNSSLMMALFLTTFSVAHCESIEDKVEIKKAELCVGIPQSTDEIKNLPFNSYSTTAGYNECISRCVRGTLVGICNQMSADHSIYVSGTKKDFLDQITSNCTEGTDALVKDNQVCPLVHCGP